jgi:diguanylate cyclase (GGDEF)-like protein/PAS domain S-box-containing protein
MLPAALLQFLQIIRRLSPMFRNLRHRLHDLFSLPQPAPRVAASFDSLVSANQTDFRSLAENSADVILRVGPDMKATYVSPSARVVLGWEPVELLGRPPKDLFIPEDLPIIESAAASLYSGDASTVAPAARIRCKDGTIKWCESRARLLDAPPDQLGDVVVVLRDVTDRIELENRLATMAMTDGLTNLANRRAFDETLSREWKATMRTGLPTSLILLDVDRFKAFNDQYGHQVGDDVLRTVAAAVTASVRRPRDFVARYGGEELAVILPETDAAGAYTVAEAVREAVQDLGIPHMGNPEGNGFVTVSLGATTAVSSLGGTIKMPEGLLLMADSALYKAKHKGRNRVEASIVLAPMELETMN